ncbi:MAG: helix-turn-helix domain-containing protein [Flavobacteriales bacterium]
MPQIRHPKYLKAFGRNLQKLRLERNMSQRELSYRIDVSFTQIGRIERGEINAGISTLYEIAQALQVEMKDLFDFDPKK